MLQTLEKLLSLNEASEQLGLTTQTLSNAIHAGELRAAKIGKGWRLRQSDVVQWLNEQFEASGQELQAA